MLLLLGGDDREGYQVIFCCAHFTVVEVYEKHRITPSVGRATIRTRGCCGGQTLSSGLATAMLGRPSGFPAKSTMLDRTSSLRVECWLRKFSWRSRSPQGSASPYAGQYCMRLIPSDEDGINSIVVLQHRRFYERVVDR